MRKSTSLFRILLLLGILFPIHTSAQWFITHERLLSFEDEHLFSSLSAFQSTFRLSTDHYKDGNSSLEWDFEPGGTLSIHKNLRFEPKDPTGVDLYLSTFVVWVYNENPIDEEIRFEFLKDGKKCSSFLMNINFKGWRAAWVCYERDMEGSPEEEMNELRIVAPQTAGKLFIDHLLTAAKTDPRHQTPDNQVPFVNKEIDNHWLVVYKHSELKPDLPLTSMNDRQKEEVLLIEKRFREQIFLPEKIKESKLDKLRKEYAKYQIEYRDGEISGIPVFFARAAEAYERILPEWNKDLISQAGVEVREYFDLMYRIAVIYNSTSDQELKNEFRRMFLSMYDHVTDQGVAYGSCWGNFTHYGYSFRNFYTSYFLMKEVLQQEGKLNDAERAMRWYAITNEVYEKPVAAGIDMDSFNTQTTGRIASILMMEDSPEKLQYLRSFARWINNGCLPSLGLAGAFKKDGGAFHHRNLYPAYAVGGLDGATHMIRLLSRTEFAVSELGHETVKNVLLAMRFYCNTRHFPLSLSGRHPDGKGKLIPIQYATLAMAGSPDGSQEVDSDMATAYLRLVSESQKATFNEPDYMPQTPNQREKEMIGRLTKKGFKPESDPNGNLAMGYGGISVQRRNNWSAVVRGHSRYLWASEHYIGNNFFGRYLAHGSMQILTGSPEKEITPMSSGWQEEGFDWARVPGTTAIRLPISELRANVLNVDAFSGVEEMLYSDEAFSGGLSQMQNNGNFGMILHEHDKYNGTHRARKSFHFLNDRIVCLGSDIENKNSRYPTETTIFQLAVCDQQGHDYWNSYQSQHTIWTDHLGTGYYVPVKASFEKNFPQRSLGQKTGKETQGDWVSLVINHGKAPTSGSYEYAVFPQADADVLHSFARKPSYRVLQQDKYAHIVRCDREELTSYVLFETPQDLPKGLVLRADTSCLIMTQEQKGKVTLTVSQPDLAFYRGASDELFDENGKRVERSIYSRPWIDNDSGEIPVTLTLKGEWHLKENDHYQVLLRNKRETVLRCICKDGASYDAELYKR